MTGKQRYVKVRLKINVPEHNEREREALKAAVNFFGKECSRAQINGRFFKLDIVPENNNGERGKREVVQSYGE